MTSEIQVDSAIVLRKSDSRSRDGKWKRLGSRDTSLTASSFSTAPEQARRNGNSAESRYEGAMFPYSSPEIRDVLVKLVTVVRAKDGVDEQEDCA